MVGTEGPQMSTSSKATSNTRTDHTASTWGPTSPGSLQYFGTMNSHYTQLVGDSTRLNAFNRQAVPEGAITTSARDTSLLQHGSITTPKWSDRVAYGTYGPLTQSGVFPHTTEYQLAYNRGPLSPLQTVYPRSWTYKPHWSTPAMLNTGVLKEFPMPDRLRFNLEYANPDLLPPVAPTLPSTMKNVENLVSAKRDSSVPEWTLRDPYRVNLVDALRDDPTRLKVDALRKCQEENQVTDKRLADTRRKLNDRVNDVNYWRKEVVSETEKLEKEIRDVDLMKQRIDREIAELDAPLRVSLENTGIRRLKKSDNAVLYLDGVDYELTKEQDAIKNAQKAYRIMAASLQAQNGRNKVLLDDLYRDSSAKHTALSIDHKCYGMRFTSPEVRAYPGIEVYENTISTPNSWTQCSNTLVLRSQQTRKESTILRQEAKNLLTKTTNELWRIWSRVNEAFRVKINQLEDHSRQLHHRYTILNQEICDLIRDADLLKRNIEEKAKPLKLTQTRLQWRSNRPGYENCHDPAHTAMRDGLTEIHQTIATLSKQLKDTEATINNLNYAKVSLEHEIKTVSDSLHRDRDRCLAVRNAFPVCFRPCMSV
ncbi:hypothetical protein RvY_16984 [Ramazzottius varieornatus]|uniref:Tektin n=1 Tax=Ramazzottius varieornatus TaxID=947166 RepID=A0A1D1W4M3_RAMVA|nr:hypothetical protein RvY_16984 [Ramazzottius varieornatus]